MLQFILWFSLSLGIQQQEPLDYPFFAEIEIHAENEYIDLYGIYKNEMEKMHSIYFRPMQDTFTVGAKIGNENISFNVEHQCSHSVNPFGLNDNIVDSGYNRIFIEINNK